MLPLHSLDRPTFGPDAKIQDWMVAMRTCARYDCYESSHHRICEPYPALH